MLQSPRQTAMDSAGPDRPVGISLAVGAAAVLVACVLGVVVPGSGTVLRWGLVVAVIGGYAAVASDVASAVFLAGTGFLIFNGFVANSTGDLSWHGRADVVRLGAEFVAVVTGAVAGRVFRAMRRIREQRQQGWDDRWLI